MKRKLLILFAFFGLLLNMSSCRMRDIQAEPRGRASYVKNQRHYGAKKNFWQRREKWGRKHYGPRPHSNRGRYRY